MALDVPSGSTVFVDSTVLHYAVVDFPVATRQCIDLLSRIAHGELLACVSIAVVNDAVHKVMCSEAVVRFGQPRAGLVSWMKRNPDRIRQLTHARDFLNLVGSLPLRTLPCDLATLADAQGCVAEHGLLASDAMVVGLMRRHGVVHLATNDDDFDPVPDITVWKPG
jgi:predicted nucleic acid-binding protein